MEIKDTVVLVTGANRGIGKELVKAFLQAGARKVYATTRKGEENQLIDPRIHWMQLDVTDAKSIKEASQIARDTQILVNNAGVLEFGNAMEVDRESFNRNLAVNFWGNLDMDRTFVPILSSHGESAIVNVLTLLSLVSAPGMSAYNVSKAAAWSLALSLRATLSEKKIKVINVFPGAVDTSMLAGVEIKKTSPSDVAVSIVNGIKNNLEDIFPDPMSESVYANWKLDHKAVEKQFAAM